MPARKAPQPEEARKYFLANPKKTLQEWGDEWGISAERVRQIRHEAGVGSVYKLDMKVVEHIANKIAKGEHTLADRELYKDLPVGFEAFKTWIRENKEVDDIIAKAQNIAYQQKLNPTNKVCLLCKKEKDVTGFKKSQKFIDGYTKVCIECISKPIEQKTLGKKVCLLCKKEKSRKSYTRNRKYRDGLVPFCKDCKSKSRRAKRTLNSKVADII